jgi:hypothetical protein
MNNLEKRILSDKKEFIFIYFLNPFFCVINKAFLIAKFKSENEKELETPPRRYFKTLIAIKFPEIQTTGLKLNAALVNKLLL